MNKVILSTVLAALLLIPILAIQPALDNEALAQGGLGGVDISVYPYRMSENNFAEYGIQRFSSSAGSASMELAPNVQHLVVVEARGYSPKILQVGPQQQGASVTLNVTLDPLPLVEGYVTLPDGTPLLGALVKSSVDQVYTDNYGYFAVYVNGSRDKLTVEPPIHPFLFALAMGDMGGLHIFFPDATTFEAIGKEVDVVTSGPRTFVNITLDYSLSLEGTVTYQDGSLARRVTVTLVDTGGGVAVGFPPMDVTDDAGRYYISTNVRPGLYNVSVTINNPYFNSTTNLMNIAQVNMNCQAPCNPPQRLDLTLPNLVKVDGRVVSANGRPVPMIRVLFSSTGVFATAFTGDDGRFTIFVPAGSHGNISLFYANNIFAPLAQFPLNVGSADTDIGDLTLQQNLYYVSGIVDGYDPNDIFWAGTILEMRVTIQLGFFNIGASYNVEINQDGTFSTFVLTGFTDFQGNPIPATYKLALKNSYVGALTDPPVDLGPVSNDISNFVVNPNYPSNRFTLTVEVSASGIPALPGPFQIQFAALIDGNYVPIQLWTDAASGFKVDGLFMRINDDGSGSLLITYETVPGQVSFSMRFGNNVMTPPFTVSYTNPDFIGPRPATVNFEDEGQTFKLDITLDNPTTNGGVFIDSPQVIPEMPTPIILLLVLAAAVALVRRVRPGLHRYVEA